MQKAFEKKEVENIEAVETGETEVSVEELGLEIVEDAPQIAMVRPVRHIRR